MEHAIQGLSVCCKTQPVYISLSERAIQANIYGDYLILLRVRLAQRLAHLIRARGRPSAARVALKPFANLVNGHAFDELRYGL